MSSHVKVAAPRVKGKMSFKAQNSRPVASSSAASKRKRPSPPSDTGGEDEDEDEDEDEEDDADLESEGDTDDEIAAAHSGKSKKTASECVRGDTSLDRSALIVLLRQSERGERHRQARLVQH